MPQTTKERLEAVERALAVLRVPAAPAEYDLHRMIAQALAAAGIDFGHEVSLGPGCRIDFLAGDVGIEVKKGRADAHLIRAQAQKYLGFDQVGALLWVTGGAARLPGTLGGKPLRVFGLNRLWGVALP